MPLASMTEPCSKFLGVVVPRIRSPISHYVKPTTKYLGPTVSTPKRDCLIKANRLHVMPFTPPNSSPLPPSPLPVQTTPPSPSSTIQLPSPSFSSPPAQSVCLPVSGAGKQYQMCGVFGAVGYTLKELAVLRRTAACTSQTRQPLEESGGRDEKEGEREKKHNPLRFSKHLSNPLDESLYCSPCNCLG